MSLQPGKIIQNYRLVRFLGDGGMGSVWLAEHTLLRRQVAVKSLHGQLLRNQGIRERFKNEAATLAHLQHERIVALHDYIEDDEGAYLVMEFVDGLPLDEYIREVSGPIPEGQLRDLFGQILEGFVYAHGKRVVHRDIKPGNFLITPDGQVKILDFGIAKILGDSDRKLTKTGTNMGTVLYMSPEQVKGQVVDQRSDIYALGVTLFQMATGSNPYSADMTEFYVYDQIVNHPLPPAHEFYPGATPETEALIAKATAKDPADRFQDVGAFLDALQNGMELEPSAREGKHVLEEQPELVAAPQAKVVMPTDAAIIPEPIVPVADAEAAPATVIAQASLPPRAPKRKRRVWPWILMLFLLGGASVGIYYGWPHLQAKPKKMWVVPEDMHLWKKAQVDSGDLGKIPFGTEVTMLESAANGWEKIEWNSKKGYVNGYYLVPFEEFEVIKFAMNEGMKKWLDKSYLRISLAQYFHDERLKANLPPKAFEAVYGEAIGDNELWTAAAKSGDSEYNTVIKGLQLEDDKYAKDGRQLDNVVILEGRSKRGIQRRLVAFKHEKNGERYDSEVLATQDISAYKDFEIRIATLDKLFIYEFEGKADIETRARKGQFPILLADPKNGAEAFLLVLKPSGKFEEIEISLAPMIFHGYDR